LRDGKSEFERMTPFVIIESVLQKWIEWLWSTKQIAEISSIYLGVCERNLLSNYVLRFSSGWLILSHFSDSAVRGYTSTSPITFRNCYFILSSLPPSPSPSPSPSPIDTDRKLSKTHIAHHLNSAFGCEIWILRGS
jgi:hypothetical protein